MRHLQIIKEHVNVVRLVAGVNIKISVLSYLSSRDVSSGLTPLKEFNGKAIDKNLLSTQMTLVRMKRIMKNKQEKCCTRSF